MTETGKTNDSSDNAEVKKTIGEITTPRGKRLFVEISMSKNILQNKYASKKGEVKEVWKGCKISIMSQELPPEADDMTEIRELKKTIRGEINEYFDGPPTSTVILPGKKEKPTPEPTMSE